MAQYKVPDQQRRKLDPKAQWGIFLGVSERSKAWVLWSVADQRVMESRDVIFHEGLNYKGWKERGASHSGTSNQDPHTASIFEGAWEDPGDEGEEQQEEPEPADSNHEESRETDSTPQPATQADAHDDQPEQHVPSTPSRSSWQQLLNQQLSKTPRTPMKRVTWEEKLQRLEEGEATPLRRSARISQPPERFTPGHIARMHDHLVSDLDDCMLVDMHGHEYALDVCLMGQVHEPRSVHEALNRPEWVESIYGLKQAPRQWYLKFDEALMDFGFERSECDPALYHFVRDEERISLFLYSFGLSEANPVRTPLPTGFDVHAYEDEPLLRDELVKLYQSIVGSLMYACTTTQPQIAFAVSQLSKVASSISWQSKRQPVVALSTTESEYISLCQCIQEGVWLRRLFGEFGHAHTGGVPVFVDNQSAIALARNACLHGRTKHMQVRWHFIREMVAAGEVILQWCPTNRQAADILTKALPFERHGVCMTLLGMQPHDDRVPAADAGVLVLLSLADSMLWVAPTHGQGGVV
ncbi:hypothetical protein CLOP_g5443 [Closterium sp. NIES-67]|nr:hypothetical protein CLOP_g5443 [Closterium sp. NIES-67]